MNKPAQSQRTPSQRVSGQPVSGNGRNSMSRSTQCIDRRQDDPASGHVGASQITASQITASQTTSTRQGIAHPHPNAAQPAPGHRISRLEALAATNPAAATNGVRWLFMSLFTAAIVVQPSLSNSILHPTDLLELTQIATPSTPASEDDAVASNASSLLTITSSNPDARNAERRQSVNQQRFDEQFNQYPDAPVPFESSRWDVALHAAAPWQWYQQPAGTLGAYGGQCESPRSQHNITAAADTVYQCDGSLLTTVAPQGFNRVTLTPASLVDLSSDLATIEFSVASFRRGSNDSVGISITPFASNTIHPDAATTAIAASGLATDNPADGSTDAIHLTLFPESHNLFKLSITSAGERIDADYCGGQCDVSTSAASSRDEAHRDYRYQQHRIRLQLSRTSLSLAVITYQGQQRDVENVFFIDTFEFDEFPWQQGVVQLSHIAGNEMVDCSPPVPPPAAADNLDADGETQAMSSAEAFGSSCSGSTLQWDDVSIAPALPFNMIASAPLPTADKRGPWTRQRYVEAGTSAQPGKASTSSVRFSRHSPRGGGYLRFSAIGTDLEVSVDGGMTWMPAERQQTLPANHDHQQDDDIHGRFTSYWHPLPPAVNTVHFRGKPWRDGDWHVRNLSIWSAPDSVRASLE